MPHVPFVPYHTRCVPLCLLLVTVGFWGCDGDSGDTCDQDGDGSTSLDCGGCDPDDANADVLLPSWYTDADADGYGADETAQQSCERPEGLVPLGGDCDDTAAGINPGMEETCNSIDDNCDGEVDEGVLVSWYPDEDGDGWGDAAAPPRVACVGMTGEVADASDCDDARTDVYPGAPEELCDATDSDCDGVGADGAAVVDGVEYEHPDAAFDATPDGGTLYFCPGTWDVEWSVESGRTMTIEAWNADPATTALSGADTHRILMVTQGATITVRYLTFEQGLASETESYGGGAVFVNNSTLSAESCLFVRNGAESGGAVFGRWSEAGDWAISFAGCTFAENPGKSVVQDGGALYLWSQEGVLLDARLTDCVFSDNQVQNSGGAIYLDSAGAPGADLPLVIENCTFEYNQNVCTKGCSCGGAIRAQGLQVSDSVFRGNMNNYGGALCASTYEDGTVRWNIERSTFENNAANFSGGALSGPEESDDVFDLQITDSTFSHNQAGSASVLYLQSGSSTVQVDGSTFENNRSDGVGLFHASAPTGLHSDLTLVVNDSSFTDNEAGFETLGAFYVESTANVAFHGGEISGNTGNAGGAGLSASLRQSTSVFDLVLDHVRIAENMAEGDTASFLGVSGETGSVSASVHDCEIQSNSSTGVAGAFQLPDWAVLESTDTDWGEGDLDNTPCDLTIGSIHDDLLAFYCDFGASSSFDCPGDGTCTSL
jgi:predicted outer membrane repeat protein